MEGKYRAEYDIVQSFSGVSWWLITLPRANPVYIWNSPFKFCSRTESQYSLFTASANRRLYSTRFSFQTFKITSIYGSRVANDVNQENQIVLDSHLHLAAKLDTYWLSDITKMRLHGPKRADLFLPQLFFIKKWGGAVQTCHTGWRQKPPGDKTTIFHFWKFKSPLFSIFLIPIDVE